MHFFSLQTEWIQRAANLFIGIHCILTLTIVINPLNQEVEQFLQVPQSQPCLFSILFFILFFYLLLLFFSQPFRRAVQFQNFSILLQSSWRKPFKERKNSLNIIHLNSGLAFIKNIGDASFRISVSLIKRCACQFPSFNCFVIRMYGLHMFRKFNNFCAD